ncbi:MAG: hypothetical protein Fur0025_27440 [Oscillatoriaceae cyanobacterium]
MAIAFGETFAKVRECFQEPTIDAQVTQKLHSITIIRDVYGKIRIFLEPQEGMEIEDADLTELKNRLSQNLGPYYGEDIWLPQGEKDGYKALIDVIHQEKIAAEWDKETRSPRWYILERHIAKLAWTNKESGNPPWSEDNVDDGHKPAVVTFFSFKGGVGRTTALVATALTLARHGHRVAMVDLDLEAPGLSTILLPDTDNLTGAIDYLLEKPIYNSHKIKITWPFQPHIKQINDQTLLGDAGETLRLLPAGTVDNDYLEKLARLDFQNLADNQLPETFRGMLRELESATRPLDFILLDARAGFHDIGGLAIADLSHAAVIFGRQSSQSWAGLTHVIRRLSLSKSEEQRLPLLLVHAMAPQLTTPGSSIELAKFRETAYDIFKENYYSKGETVPNQNDTDAPFTPLVLSWHDNLQGDIALFPRDNSQEEAIRLLAIVDAMTSQPYQNLADRLCRLFERNLKKSDQEG